MHLLILSTEFLPGPGGIGEHGFQLAKNLQALGWRVTVVTRQDYVDSGQRDLFNRNQPFEVITFPDISFTALDGIVRWYTAYQLIRSKQPDVLVATGLRSVWISSLLPTRIPWVAIGHGTEFGIQGWQFPITKFAFQQATHVICVSRFTQSIMLARRIQPAQTTVIHNGADETKYFPLSTSEIDQFRPRLGFSKKERLLLTVGNVTERKGQEVVIRAMPMIMQAMPDVHYLVVGMPTLKETLQDLGKQLGVHNHVHFLGRLATEDLVTAYNACDLFVMTSRHTSDGDFEGYGIAVIEAALCGKAAVVAGNSGLAEAVMDQQTGIVVPENDPVATATTIIELLRNDVLRSKMSNNAREHAVSKATWSQRVTQYDSLLRGLIK